MEACIARLAGDQAARQPGAMADQAARQRSASMLGMPAGKLLPAGTLAALFQGPMASG